MTPSLPRSLGCIGLSPPTGALGFATAENIEYVFGSSDGTSAIPGTSLFVGKYYSHPSIQIITHIQLLCVFIRNARIRGLV